MSQVPQGDRIPTRVVCFPNCAYLSETSRMIAIHQALTALGVDAVMASHGGTHEHLLTDSGIDWDRVEPQVSMRRSQEFVANTPGIGSPRQSMWSDSEIRTTAMAERDYLDAVGADAVVNGFQLTTLISSRLSRIPLVTSHAGSWVPPVMERGLVPASTTFLPPPMRVLPRRMLRYLANRGALKFRGFTKGFDRVAKQLGVEGIPSLPALLCGDLTLVTEAPELIGISDEEMRNWRSRFGGVRTGTTMRYVGPLFAQLPIAIPPAVHSFLRAPGPVVYVALTSTPASTVRETVAAVRAAGARALVVSTVHDVAQPEDDGVLVADFLPSHLVMREVQAAVVTGGQGSVQTALAAGTPFIGMPLQPEQEWNVALAEKQGAARMVSVRAIEGSLPVALRELLADDGARAQAQRVAEIYAKYDGPALAAQAIIDYLGAGVESTGLGVSRART
jgi:UDP:flavonoid glycosyltransferase YjiC (YdhE family)